MKVIKITQQTQTYLSLHEEADTNMHVIIPKYGAKDFFRGALDKVLTPPVASVPILRRGDENQYNGHTKHVISNY